MDRWTRHRVDSPSSHFFGGHSPRCVGRLPGILGTDPAGSQRRPLVLPVRNWGCDVDARPKNTLSIYTDVVGMAGFILLVITPLVLRAEIRSLYQRSHGVNLPINPLLTILFSSAYLNWHLLDLPIPAAPAETPHVQSASR